MNVGKSGGVPAAKVQTSNTQRLHRRSATRKMEGEGKSVPLQAWGGAHGSRKLRFLDFTTTAQDCGGKVVSPTHRPPLPPGNTPGTHFC